MKNFQTILLCLFVLCLSCNKDDSPSINDQNQGTDPSAFAANFGSEIQRNFLGKVIDKNHDAIQGVTITIGSATAQTDANGIFIINNATVNQRFGYVKAEKAGYLHGSRSVVPSVGTNKVTIMLLEENVVGTTNSGTAETIALPNGASVSLQGDYIKEDGTAYSGSVSVIMHHLDPADDDMQYQMPGMLYAANAQNEERMLQTFGMLAVELKGSGGETLNLADGSSAEIKVPLDASLLANAPSTIPLWHFDETYGYWIEDGQATLVGNAYVGTVTHFSFWNCDIPAEVVNLCVNVTNENGNMLSNLLVVITSNIYGSSEDFTNSLGAVCGLVPSNEPLEIYIYNDNCGDNLIYSVNIGPFVSDSSINIIIPNDPVEMVEKVTGKFYNCDNEPITNGYVILKYGNSEYVDFVSQGTYEIYFPRCVNDNSFNIEAIDFDLFQSTGNINFTLTSPWTKLGSLVSCSTIDEFIQVTFDDTETTTYFEPIYDLTARVIPNDFGIRTSANITMENSADCFGIFALLHPLPSIGTYGYGYDPFGNSDDVGFMILCPDDIYANINISFNITYLGNPGDFIDINFNGNYVDMQGIPHTINGIIHVRRDY